MKRFPNGIHDMKFFQKSAESYYPGYIILQPVKRTDHSIINYPLVNNKKALHYLANMVGEFHIWLSHAPKLNYPDRMIFDLDPSKGVLFSQIKWAASTFKKLLDELNITSFVMTTGSRGLHVVIPLKQTALFDDVKRVAQKIARVLVDRYPDKLTLVVSKSKRGKKIFVDTLRNAWSATSVAPYSVRALEAAPVATPITWQELPRLVSSQQYTIKTLPARLKKKGDIWADLDAKAERLSAIEKKIDNLKENNS